MPDSAQAVAPVRGLVLAGGQSRRMGRDKALLSRGNETQLAFAVQLLGRVVPQVFVSTRPDQAGEAERSRFPQIADRYDNLGPIAGVLSAMDRYPASAWLVLACDLPNVDQSTLEALLTARAPQQPFTAFKSSHDDLPEPLCALYEPAARDLIDAFVAAGTVCPRKMMLRSDTRLLDQPNPRALDNVNTPSDLQHSRLESAS